VQAHVSEWSLSTLPSPIPELQHAPLPLKVLWAKERASTPSFSAVFYLGSHLSPLRSWESASTCHSVFVCVVVDAGEPVFEYLVVGQGWEFMAIMASVAFQWRWRLFWTLITLVPVHICARMVHSIPPMSGSSCQLHSRWSRSLRASLYLRTFSSSSDSRRKARSSRVEAWVHPSSGGPAILM